jgi:hypothetical protein
MTTRAVKFSATRIVEDYRQGTPDEERFEAGRTYILPVTSADRWVRRGVAEYVGKSVDVLDAALAAAPETPAAAEATEKKKRQRRAVLDSAAPIASDETKH